MTVYNQTENKPARKQTVPLSRVALAGLASIAAAVLANLLVRALLFAVLPLSAEFPPLQPGAIIFFTVMGTFFGTLVYALISRRAKRPARLYTLIAVVALIVSILPNFGFMLAPAAAPFPGGNAMSFGVLIVFHIVAAFVHVFTLLRLAAPKA